MTKLKLYQHTGYWISCTDMKLVDFFVVCFEGFKDVWKVSEINQIFLVYLIKMIIFFYLPSINEEKSRK